MAGHKTGFMVKENPSQRVYIEADPKTLETRLVVAYHVLGDTVTVIGIKVVVT